MGIENNNRIIFPLKKRVEVSQKDWECGDYPLHYHDYYEMEIVTSGSGHQFFNGIYFELNKGDIFLLKPLEYHQIHSDNITFSHVTVKEEVLPKWLAKKLSLFRNPVVFHLNEEEYESFVNIYKLLDIELKKENDKSITPIETIIELLFILFLNLDKEGINVAIGSENDIVAKIIYFLQKNKKFTEKVSLQDIAENIGYSKYYTSSLFHKLYGTTIQDFIISLRIEYAKKLMIESNYSITDIIMECGFVSPSNFYAKFTKSVGCSPTQFKQQHIKNNKEQKNENFVE